MASTNYIWDKKRNEHVFENENTKNVPNLVITLFVSEYIKH